MNFYIGGLFMVLGALLLHRVYKRRGIVSTDLGISTPDSLSTKNQRDEDDSETLLLRESTNPGYKGGIGADILHDPL